MRGESEGFNFHPEGAGRFIRQYPVVQFKPSTLYRRSSESARGGVGQGYDRRGETFEVLRWDGFVQKIPVKQIGSLARAVGYLLPGPVPVETILHSPKSRRPLWS
jgi:hypothetical protein